VIAWAIIVPLLGLAITVATKIWEILEFFMKSCFSLAGKTFDLVVKVYNIYEKHPVYVFVLLGLYTLSFVIWHWKRPKQIPRWVKAGVCLLLFIFTLCIISPIADLFAQK
jgi:hypothetical protein